MEEKTLGFAENGFLLPKSEVMEAGWASPRFGEDGAMGFTLHCRFVSAEGDGLALATFPSLLMEAATFMMGSGRISVDGREGDAGIRSGEWSTEDGFLPWRRQQRISPVAATDFADVHCDNYGDSLL
ncbi:hypothetical protein ACLOJK_006674 [Asimina triloba]